MVDDADTTIFETGLREMQEEVGVDAKKVQVLGILRCEWSKVQALTGVAVTPVVGYMGELSASQLNINLDEVERCFTVPLEVLMENNNWTYPKESAPVFHYEGTVIWGLTAFLLDSVLNQVVLPIAPKPDLEG